MRAMSGKRRRSTVAMRKVRPLVDERCGGVCDRCGYPLRISDDGSHEFHMHHRRQRSAGGTDDAANILALHPDCHDWVHRNIAQAESLGLIENSWETPNATA